MAKKDPWDLDYDAGKKAVAGISGGTKLGRVCPLKNYGKKCKICEKAAALFKTGNKQDDVIARSIYAKKQCFFPVIIPDLKMNKPFILHVPVSVAEEILLNVYQTKLWGNIFHPVKGRLIYVTKIPPKSQGDWTSYKTTPDLDGGNKLKSMAVIKAIPDLDTIIKMVSDEPDIIIQLKNILKNDETIGIRFLPDPKNPSKPPIRIVWTHFVDDITFASLDELGAKTTSEEILDTPFDEDDDIPDWTDNDEEDNVEAGESEEDIWA